jgi:hypothetical protein
MPYSIDRKNKCVYKKKGDGSRGEKVGCTKGSLNDYIAALQIHAEMKIPKKKSLKEALEEPQIPGAINQLYAVKKPYSGCELTSLVKPIDPLMGIGAGHEILPDEIHAVFADPDMAKDVANELYEEHSKKMQALEEKKGDVSDKLKKAIDALEKKRKEHMEMAKEDPKNASQHRDHIAQIVSKVDDFMSKLEKIEKSKKEVVKEDDKKKKIKK